MRKLLLAVVTVALVLALYSPAWAQQDQHVSGDGPYSDPESPSPDSPAACQYESDCDRMPARPGGTTMMDGQGGGKARVEAATGDPGDAAALKGAIEAARADRAGGVTLVAASEPAGGEDKTEAKASVEEKPADGEDKTEAKANVEEKASGGEDAGAAAIKESGSVSGARPLALLGAGSVLLLVGAGLLLRRTLR